MAADDPVIRFETVSFSYGEVPVLTEVGLALAPGELAYLVGRSGSGKSTLLGLAHGQLRPRAGRVSVDGVALHRAPRRAVQRLRRRVAMVFQDSRLLPRLTALENVAYALRVADLRLGAGEARRRALATLCEVGLENRLYAFPRQLSAGQRQRVAAARAVASGPAVLLADEPTVSQDTAAAAAILGLFRRVARSGSAVLIATCDEELAAAGRRDGARLLRLEDGALGEPEEVARCAAV